jgi:ORF6N domain
MPTHRIAFQPIEYEGIAKPTIRILALRGQRVVLDSDLAAIYGVSTGHFNEAV